MKKLISVLLIVTLIMSCCVTAFAASSTDVKAAVDKADDFYFWYYFCDGAFEKGEDPKTETVYGMIPWLETKELEKYAVDSTAGVPATVTHMIPAADFEALVAKHFVLSDSLVAALRAVSERYIDGYYYYYIGGFGDRIPEYVFQGYKDLGNGEIELYAYEAGDDYQTYVPGPNDVEGVDYLYLIDSYVDEETGEVVAYGGPYKILSTLVSTFKLEGGNCVMTSYTTKPASVMPSANELLTIETTTKNDITIDFDYGVFESGTEVTCVEVKDEVTKTKVETALGDKVEKFVAYDASATLNGAAVQPNGKVLVTFAVPAGFSKNVAVYYIADNGLVEEVKATYDAATNTIIAELEHFSTYAVVDLGDTTPGNNPVPPTGDATNLILWITVAIVTGGVATILKKREN